MKNQLITLLLATLCFTSCGEDADDGTTATEEDGPDVAGTWVQSCKKGTDSDGKDEYQKKQFTFADGKMTETLFHYNDQAGCADADLAWRWDVSASYEVKGQGEIADTFAIIMKIEGSTFTIAASMVDFFNSQKICGKADWVSNTAVDITGNTDNCFFGSLLEDLKKAYPNGVSRSYKINDDGTMVMDEDGSLDNDHPFTKQ